MKLEINFIIKWSIALITRFQIVEELTISWCDCQHFYMLHIQVTLKCMIQRISPIPSRDISNILRKQTLVNMLWQLILSIKLKVLLFQHILTITTL